LGAPSADKRGRRDEWPYVPVLLGHPQGGRDGKLQILGKAFATRDEAVAWAAKTAQHQRDVLRTKLLAPNMRALREQYGLPRNVPGWTDAGQNPVTASLRALLPAALAKAEGRS